MKQRIQAHKWDRIKHEFYLEPEWCSQRLFEVEQFKGKIVDPACGRGRIVSSAKAAGYNSIGRDLVKRGPLCQNTRDFLSDNTRISNVVSNPPFSIAEEFARHALEVCAGKLALLLPIVWLTGKTRSQWLEKSPILRVWMLAPRPWMEPGQGKVEKRGGKRDFCWVVWDKDWRGAPRVGWLRRDG